MDRTEKRRFIEGNTISIGIDADTKGIAWAVAQVEAVQCVGYRKRMGRSGRIEEGYDGWLTRFMQRACELGAVIYLEDIYLAEKATDDREASTRNVASFKALAQVQGELIHEARKHGVQVELVSADTWRKEVLGVTRPREACKKAAEMKAGELMGVIGGRTEHENEAILIAWYGARQMDALEKVKG